MKERDLRDQIGNIMDAVRGESAQAQPAAREFPTDTAPRIINTAQLQARLEELAAKKGANLRGHHFVDPHKRTTIRVYLQGKLTGFTVEYHYLLIPEDYSDFVN